MRNTSGHYTIVKHITFPEKVKISVLRQLVYGTPYRIPLPVIPFPVDNPSSFVSYASAMTFPTPDKVKILGLDGHFGLHRRLNEWRRMVVEIMLVHPNCVAIHHETKPASPVQLSWTPRKESSKFGSHTSKFLVAQKSICTISNGNCSAYLNVILAPNAR